MLLLNNLTTEGESRDGVVVQYEKHEHYNTGTGSSLSLTALTGTSGVQKLTKQEGAGTATEQVFVSSDTWRRACDAAGRGD